LRLKTLTTSRGHESTDLVGVIDEVVPLREGLVAELTGGPLRIVQRRVRHPSKKNLVTDGSFLVTVMSKNAS